ncbi:MAG: glycoside hydrolase family 3 C-terminal domain-containing protein [Firmicutes bacterium]|nr:glycoside hydrolase family 3 C-terminal domain-containing protein [Bacillota bacterium]
MTAERIEDLLQQMTLEEKARLCSGLDRWRTKPIERLGIPSIRMSDGPHGLRKEGGPDQEMRDSVPSTCFPTASALASSWDRDLMWEIGRALAEECLAEDVQVLLGPGVNIKRHPLCGRNFEYFSEDPYLAGEMAVRYVQGLQSLGVGVSLKHFAANNQETLRLSINAVVDERPLREIYLAQFERVVREAQPWTVMAAYNQLNGDYCSEHPWLLNEVLRGEWGFAGVVVSDWGAVNDRVAALRAGLDLEMPFEDEERDRRIAQAVRDGALPESVLDASVRRLLHLIFTAYENRRPNFAYDRRAHHALAIKALEQSAVLLKNEGALLPLGQSPQRIAVIGELARVPRIQGGGSAHVHPHRVDLPWEEMVRWAGPDVTLSFARGYVLGQEAPEESLIGEAQDLARGQDAAVLFLGQPEWAESEGYDRATMALPEAQVRLLKAVKAVQPRVAVVLASGAPVTMPWLPWADALLQVHLGGEGVGSAVARLLFGHANPSGKLAETYPQTLEQTPAYVNFPGGTAEVRYDEGVFVGYRYYDAKGESPLFPFGFGLSYTTFAYRRLAVDKAEMEDKDTLRVTVEVENTGPREGAEVILLYVSPPERTRVVRPVRELKAFAKVTLAPGQREAVDFVLDRRAFAYYDAARGDWVVESGQYRILVGPSSRDLPLQQAVRVRAKGPVLRRVTRKTPIGDLLAMPETEPVMRVVLEEYVNTLSGALMRREERDGPVVARRWLEETVENMKYSHLRQLVGRLGRFSEADLDRLIGELNRRLGTDGQ